MKQNAWFLAALAFVLCAGCSLDAGYVWFPMACIVSGVACFIKQDYI